MGQGSSTLILVNNTDLHVNASAQVVALERDHDKNIDNPVLQTVPPRQQASLKVSRHQYFDIRCNVMVSLSNGAAGKFRINVPPKEVVYTVEINTEEIRVDGNVSGRFSGGSKGSTSSLPAMAAVELPPSYDSIAARQPVAGYPRGITPAPVPAGSGVLAPPPASSTVQYTNAPPSQPVPVASELLPAETTLVLVNQASQHSIRILDGGRVDALGARGPYARFQVDPSPTGFLRLRNVHNPARYLAIRGGQVTSGRGGKFCELCVQSVGGNLVVLRSKDEAYGVGFDAHGHARLPRDVKYDVDAQFEYHVL